MTNKRITNKSIIEKRNTKKIETRGRPPLPEEDRAEPRAIRLSAARWEKLKLLGREWLERKIDAAKL